MKNPPEICLLNLSSELGHIEDTLREHFSIVKLDSIAQLQQNMKTRLILSLVILSKVRTEQDVERIREICFASKGSAHVVYAKIMDPELAFRLAKSGIEFYVRTGNVDRLIRVLNDLAAKVNFRIDLSDFLIDVNRCPFWARRFVHFLTRDENFLLYHKG